MTTQVKYGNPIEFYQNNGSLQSKKANWMEVAEKVACFFAVGAGVALLLGFPFALVGFGHLADAGCRASAILCFKIGAASAIAGACTALALLVFKNIRASNREI